MPAISVIVPVYKVEPYLHSCVDSILAQSFTDFEVILVDDGSPDNCGAICDDYAAIDKRVRVIHQKNQGVSAARNQGLEKAQGAFILFVDADDMIASDSLQFMVKLQTEVDADIVICGRTHTWPVHYTADESITVTHMNRTGFLRCRRSKRHATGRLFRADTCKAVLFPYNIRVGEDTIFNYTLLLQNPEIRIVDCNRELYYWRIRNNSASYQDACNIGFFNVGNWCLNEYRTNVNSGKNIDFLSELLVEAIKEFLLFRQLSHDKMDRKAVNSLLRQAECFVFAEKRFTIIKKIVFCGLIHFPIVYVLMQQIL